MSLKCSGIAWPLPGVVRMVQQQQHPAAAGAGVRRERESGGGRRRAGGGAENAGTSQERGSAQAVASLTVLASTPSRTPMACTGSCSYWHRALGEHVVSEPVLRHPSRPSQFRTALTRRYHRCASLRCSRCAPSAGRPRAAARACRPPVSVPVSARWFRVTLGVAPFWARSPPRLRIRGRPSFLKHGVFPLAAVPPRCRSRSSRVESIRFALTSCPFRSSFSSSTLVAYSAA